MSMTFNSRINFDDRHTDVLYVADENLTRKSAVNG